MCEPPTVRSKRVVDPFVWCNNSNGNCSAGAGTLHTRPDPPAPVMSEFLNEVFPVTRAPSRFAFDRFAYTCVQYIHKEDEPCQVLEVATAVDDLKERNVGSRHARKHVNTCVTRNAALLGSQSPLPSVLELARNRHRADPNQKGRLLRVLVTNQPT